MNEQLYRNETYPIEYNETVDQYIRRLNKMAHDNYIQSVSLSRVIEQKEVELKHLRLVTRDALNTTMHAVSPND